MISWSIAGCGISSPGDGPSSDTPDPRKPTLPRRPNGMNRYSRGRLSAETGSDRCSRGTGLVAIKAESHYDGLRATTFVSKGVPSSLIRNERQLQTVPQEVAVHEVQDFRAAFSPSDPRLPVR